MSLLLDALKKAAQEKQGQQEKQTSAVDTTVAAPAMEDPSSEAQELTLELDAMEAPDNAVDTTENEPALHILEIPETNIAQDLPILADDITPPDVEIRAEAASFAAQKKSALKKSLPENASIEIVAPLAKEKKAAEKPAGEKPAGEKPETGITKPAISNTGKHHGDALDMMINKSRAANERRRHFLVYGVAVICLLLIILAGGYFYLNTEPAPLPLATTDNTLKEITNETMATTEPVAEQASVAPVTEPAVVKHTNTVARKPAKKTARSIPSPAATTEQPVQFTRSVRLDPVEQLLGQAYEKFQAGDYEGAKSLYTDVLQREPDNRDGLLGAAAVAMKQQRFDMAQQKYQQLLLLDPKDSYARAGMASIERDARDESQLKSMLREQPDAAHLHFALGSLYASETRWAEAQQSWFNAFAGDSSNADYAYNLAVSLDRLGQYKTASRYYQQALQLNEKRRGGFVAADLQKRMEQIARMPESVK